MAIDTIRVMGRATQGVKLIELQKRNDTLMFGCIVPKEESETVAQSVETEGEAQVAESVEN